MRDAEDKSPHTNLDKIMISFYDGSERRNIANISQRMIEDFEMILLCKQSNLARSHYSAGYFGKNMSREQVSSLPTLVTRLLRS